MRARRAGGTDAGQASIELIALVPALVLLGLVLLQLLAVGYSAVLTGAAAEAGALALAAGGDARAGVGEALPAWLRARARVEVRADGVRVRLRPPSPLQALSDSLEVESYAAVHAP